MDGLRGKFLVLDGPDGGGKTTVGRLLARRLTDAGLSVVQCRDPGGTKVGDRIRSVLLDFDLASMDIRCETFLFMASRAQLVTEIIRPALTAGKLVLCDRFISATCAYQAAAGYDFEAILSLGRQAVGTTWPDLTIVLDVPPDVGSVRIHRRPDDSRSGTPPHDATSVTARAKHLDAMERRPREFHDQVRANFLALPGRYPAPVEIVDASAPVEQVLETLWERLKRLHQPNCP
jgi:dTMP kinase